MSGTVAEAGAVEKVGKLPSASEVAEPNGDFREFFELFLARFQFLRRRGPLPKLAWAR